MRGCPPAHSPERLRPCGLQTQAWLPHVQTKGEQVNLPHRAQRRTPAPAVASAQSVGLGGRLHVVFQCPWQRTE